MSAAPELPLTAVLVRSPDQVSGDLDGRVVLLSIQNGEYYNMNAVGSRVWALLETPTTAAALIERLMGEFEVERGQCEREVVVFLEKLRQSGLLKIEVAQP